MFNTDAERVSFNTCEKEKNVCEMLNGRTAVSIGGTSCMQEKLLSTDSTFSDLISRSFSIMYATQTIYADMSCQSPKSPYNLGNIECNTIYFVNVPLSFISSVLPLTTSITEFWVVVFICLMMHISSFVYLIISPSPSPCTQTTSSGAYTCTWIPYAYHIWLNY